MLDSTANSVYGFVHGLIPVGEVQSETQSGNDGNFALLGPNLSFGPQNPLFWVLILALIFTGWVFGGFDFGVKKIGGVNVKVGK